jgi:hypothetical protein
MIGNTSSGNLKAKYLQVKEEEMLIVKKKLKIITDLFYGVWCLLFHFF